MTPREESPKRSLQKMRGKEVSKFWKEYVEEHGKPVSVYLDKFSTYKVNHKNAVDNHELLTQFEGMTQRIGIKLITAHSPEAKGRIERLFKTLQDRLVKEMRLLHINNPEEGNRYLKDVFIPAFNKQFGVAPSKEGDVHKLLSAYERENLPVYFQSKTLEKSPMIFAFNTKINGCNWERTTDSGVSKRHSGD